MNEPITVEELRKYASDDFLKLNAAKLGIPSQGTLPAPRINQGGRFSHAVRDLLNSQPKQNKYHVSAKEDRTYKGIVFSSKKEAAKAAELDLCVQAGEIDFWIRQVPFIVGYDPLTKYVADFVTFSSEWVETIEDWRVRRWEIKVIETKGVYAPGAKRKLKLFRQKYPYLDLEIC